MKKNKLDELKFIMFKKRLRQIEIARHLGMSQTYVSLFLNGLTYGDPVIYGMIYKFVTKAKGRN